MQPTNQPFGTPASRPIPRTAVSGAPMQRSNYGIPLRQPAPMVAPVQSAPQPIAPRQPVIAPQAAGPQFMDIAPSRPVPATPAPVYQPAPSAVTPAAAPVPVAAQPAVASAPVAPARPLFTPSTTAVPAANKPAHQRHFGLKLARNSLLIVAGLLLIAGGARWFTAGSTANDTIAVGAVAANDGRSMTIQFTATDGKLHKISLPSDQDLIPGSGVEMAYRSGAPEATARMVPVIKAKRSQSVVLIAAGIATLAVAGAIITVMKLKARSKRRALPLTTAVTA